MSIKSMNQTIDQLINNIIITIKKRKQKENKRKYHIKKYNLIEERKKSSYIIDMTQLIKSL